MAAIPGSVRMTGFIAPTDSADTYAVTDPTYGRGGLRSVANIAARNAITYDRRWNAITGSQLGMEVVTVDTMNKYRLINEPGTPGTTDTDWELMETGDLWDSDGTDLTPHTAENVILPTNKRYSFDQPLNSTFYATYSTTINGTWGLGNLLGTAVGGASIVGSELDLAHSDNRYVWYDATSNADNAQVGSFKFKIIPNYSGAPAAVRPIFSVGKVTSDSVNALMLWHSSSNTIKISIYDWNAVAIINDVSFGTWNPTALTEYEFELNFDITTGATRLFIDGVQLGATLTSTGVRTPLSITKLLIGQLITVPSFLSNIYIKDFIVFNAVQHTANYIPGYTLQNIQFSTGSTCVNNLHAYGAVTLSSMAVADGLLQTDTNGNVSSNIELPDVITTVTPLTTFNKTIRESIDELNAFPNKINKDISYFCTATPTQTLATAGAGDLATKIATLVDGDILEIQTDASYSAITIPAGKTFAIRVKKGYDVELNSAQAITLLNGAANVFLAGFIFDSNPSGGNDKGSAICFEHQAIVSDITFYYCTFRNNNGSAVMLSYHQTIGGDFYYTAPLLSEFSSRIAFVECNFDRAASDATEGGAITMRGISIPYIADCNINARGISRGIQLQDCLYCLVSGNKVLNAGGSGNGEGIKLDQLGTSTYYNSGVFYRNIVDGCIEGIDIDDTDEAIVQENIVSNCSNEGIVLDDSSKGVFIGNITYNNEDGIRLELGSVANLKCNVSFSNTSNNYRMDNSYVPDNSNTTAIPDTFIGADKIPYDNTISGLASTLVNDAIDEVEADTIYTNASPTPATLGGIPAGSTFSAVSDSDMWTALLYPYQYPAFTSFSITGQATSVEVGVSISGAHTFTWGTSNSSNVATNSINIYDITGAVTLFTGLANDGSEAYSFPSPIQLILPGSYVWQIEGTNTHVPPTTFNRNLTVNWYWRRHWGTSALTSLTSAQILALANTDLSSIGTGSFSFAAGDYKYFCIPTSFTQPTNFIDHSTGFPVAMEAPVVVSVTNAYSIVTNYNVYRSTNTLASTITIDIS